MIPDALAILVGKLVPQEVDEAHIAAILKTTPFRITRRRFPGPAESPDQITIQLDEDGRIKALSKG